MKVSNFIIPLMFLAVIIYGFRKKINVYDVFIEGSKESFDMIFKLFPCLLAMILGVNLFLNSNPFLFFKEIAWLPNEIISLAIMRPISGTSSLALLANIYSKMGPDGYIGTLASLIQGTTDTTFYILTLYFGSVGIKKIKYALWVGLLTDLAAIVFSIVAANIIF